MATQYHEGANRFAAIGDRKETPQPLCFKDETANVTTEKDLIRSSGLDEGGSYGSPANALGNLGPNHL